MDQVGKSISEVLKGFQQGRCSREDTLRALIAYSEWRLQLDDLGQPEQVPSDDGTPFVIAESSVNHGHVVDGRSLVQEFVPESGGIVFDPDESWGLLFKPEQLPELQQWVQIVDLEDAILCPAPGQAKTLRQGFWWGVVAPGCHQLASYRDTHREGVRAFGVNAVVVIYEAWWGYEPRQIAFAVVESASAPLELGNGPSQILCAGLLLRFVRGQLAGLPRFRWQANLAQKQRAATALRGISELGQLIDRDAIPFSAVRTPEGAYLWHLEPEAFTATAVAVMRQRAEALAS